MDNATERLHELISSGIADFMGRGSGWGPKDPPSKALAEAIFDRLAAMLVIRRASSRVTRCEGCGIVGRIEVTETSLYVETLDGTPLRAEFVSIMGSTRITRKATVGAEEIRIVEQSPRGKKEQILPRDPELLFPAAVRKKVVEILIRPLRISTSGAI